MSQSSNSSLALTVFVVITLIYIVVDVYIDNNPTGTFSKNILLMGYVILVVVVEYGLNFVISESICKEVQPMSAFISAILSWGLIFIPLVYVLVYVMPGWLAPFANTFGHGIALILGLDDVLDKLLTDPEYSDKSLGFKTTMARINSNRLILINEVTPDNFVTFKDSMNSIFNSDNLTENLNNFKYIVDVKYATAKFIWFILIGILSTSISYNYLLKSSCVISSSTARKNREKYNKQLNDEQV